MPLTTPRRPPFTRRVMLAVIGILVGVGGIVVGLVRDVDPAAATPASSTTATSTTELSYSRLTNPGRTLVSDTTGTVVATLTDGARTVNLVGPQRTFLEPDFTAATVTTHTWVRLLPGPWAPGAEQEPWFRPWLDQQLHNRDPDVLAVATEYLHHQPDIRDANNVRYRGDAEFGPPNETATSREENSDFYDYLGVPWSFSDGRQEFPDPIRYGNIDYSGYLRLVYGYRMGYPLLGTNTAGPGLPRRASAMAEFGPGVVMVSDQGRPVDNYASLQPGDLVFFNVDPGIDPHVDHSGIYLGLDDSGHHRFISSRATANGPTLGDLGGTALLDDGGFYSTAFRTAKRL
ncbi:MAG: C40 family peptidase [Actinobacteria bacterium]|nr:C40 family peptidase [Actinomycetota bacterium]